MVNFTLPEVLALILFIVPGYLVIYFISLITDYKHEKDTLEKIIQYLLFSFISYGFAMIIPIVILILGFIFPETSFNLIFDYIWKNPIILTGLAILISPSLGIIFGHKYFSKGYPHKHFKDITNKTNFPSIYSQMFQEFKKGCWITCSMKNGEKIQGRLVDYGVDERVNKYDISIENAIKISKDNSIKLIADKTIIDLSNCDYVQFKK